MTLRCGCLNDGDEIVFGSSHECTLKPEPAPKRESLAALAARAHTALCGDPDALHPHWDRLDADERRGD